MPVLSFFGNREEYKLNIGVFDNNMLGRNISLGLEGAFGTNAKYGNINIGIPRQLLYRNMTLGARFNYGTASVYLYDNGAKISGVGYSHTDFNLHIGNPWHDDYNYKFSPDLSLGYFNHQSDSALIEPGLIQPAAYTVNYLTISAAESIGLMNRKRHQRDGYNISAGIGSGVGLSKESPAYISAGFSGVFSKLFSRFLQIDGSLSSGYTTSGLPSLISYLGPGHVKGLLSGEKAGKSIISSAIAVRLTYINRNWFAIEQSFFINAGNAADVYWHLFNTPPLASAGSSLRLMVPMVPWLAISFHYAWMGNTDHWFSADF
jgi:outer membrane protein assembly factor BamA